MKRPVIIPLDAKEKYFSDVAKVKTNAAAVWHSVLAHLFPNEVCFVFKAPSAHNLQAFRQKRIRYPQVKMRLFSGDG